ncbi:hypothetical protein, partial [Burkholderia cenocepacia]|uniref:hypothetical protein n=1 Tax=Burkholderia cenocepacia TaxID=95486 RepID=UPI001E358086
GGRGAAGTRRALGPPATLRFALAAVASQPMRRPFHLIASDGAGLIAPPSGVVILPINRRSDER